MSAKSSKGLTICITTGASTPTNIVATAISTAKPAIVSIASTTGMADGDIVVCKSTGFTELDGKSFIVANMVADTTFELLGSDTTGSTGTLATTPTIDHYAVSDMECLCLSDLGMNQDEQATIAVGTYCTPSASIVSAAGSAGTVTFSGYVNIADKDYKELLLAGEDGKMRYIRIMLPTNGYLLAPVTFGSMAFSLPLDGAISYTGTGVLGSKIRHLF